MKQISRYLGATLLAGIADEVSDLRIAPPAGQRGRQSQRPAGGGPADPGVGHVVGLTTVKP